MRRRPFYHFVWGYPLAVLLGLLSVFFLALGGLCERGFGVLGRFLYRENVP